MNKSIIVFLAGSCLPFSLSAQSSDSISPGGEKSPGVFLGQTRPVTYLQVSFNILDFFKTFNSSADLDTEVGWRNETHPKNEKEVKKVKEDIQKLGKLGFRLDDLNIRGSTTILKRTPFELVFFEGMVYLIDPKNPTRAVTLEGPEGFFATQDQLSQGEIRLHFANEVDGAAVEKISEHTFRIFVQNIGGEMKTGESPRITVWDYDLKNNSITTYDFSSAFARDVEKKGRRDVVLYDEGFRDKSNEWGIREAQVLSWDGEEWVDISDREKGFIRELIKTGY